MKVTFLHLGDVHLGNEQYGRKERAGDFADAFHYAVQYAIQHGVDFVIVAGDLFERSTLDPVTFDQSVSNLAQLAAAGIPVVAIAGNHDRARYGQEQPWLQSMSRQGYLAYLDAVGPEGIRLTPWSQEEGVGGYVEVRGVRVVGFRYLGAATARIVAELSEAMRAQWDADRPYTVAMIHGGMDGVVPNYRAEITLPQLAPLRGLADYVALGHIHEHYVREEWVYNPGSLETWSATEAGLKRGFLRVEVDSSRQPSHRVELVEPPRRPFLRYRLEVEPCRGPAELLELVRRQLAEWAAAARAEKPVVHLTLRGRLRFDRRELDMRALEAEIASAFDPLVVQLRDQTEDTGFGAEAMEEAQGSRVDRSVLELRAMRHLFSNDERRVHRASAWALLAQELKLGVLSGQAVEELADLVRREYPGLVDRGDAPIIAHPSSLITPDPEADSPPTLQPTLFGEVQP